jgi:hypothetical protein
MPRSRCRIEQVGQGGDELSSWAAVMIKAGPAGARPAAGR